jgi:hypothetical protein
MAYRRQVNICLTSIWYWGLKISELQSFIEMSNQVQFRPNNSLLVCNLLLNLANQASPGYVEESLRKLNVWMMYIGYRGLEVLKFQIVIKFSNVLEFRLYKNFQVCDFLLNLGNQAAGRLVEPKQRKVNIWMACNWHRGLIVKNGSNDKIVNSAP